MTDIILLKQHQERVLSAASGEGTGLRLSMGDSTHYFIHLKTIKKWKTKIQYQWYAGYVTDSCVSVTKMSWMVIILRHRVKFLSEGFVHWLSGSPYSPSISHFCSIWLWMFLDVTFLKHWTNNKTYKLCVDRLDSIATALEPSVSQRCVFASLVDCLPS